MLESLHRIGSKIRHDTFLEKQNWIWESVEPKWQTIFQRLTATRGFAAYVNGDLFNLEYSYASRYDRMDKREYEPVFYKAFVEQIAVGMTVFDIGAHIGLFTLAASKRVGSSGLVFAFEPAPTTFETLNKHINFNGFQDHAKAVAAVAADTDGVIPFYFYEDSMAASISFANAEGGNTEVRQGKTKQIEVSAVTLDSFCEARKIKPDVIKIDVEGAELHVLRGAKNLLMNGRVIILCEIHPTQMENCGASISAFQTYLDEIGYAIEPLDEPNDCGIYHGLIKCKL